MQQRQSCRFNPRTLAGSMGQSRGSSFLERVRRADRVACGRRRATDNHARATGDRARPGGGCPQPSDNRASDDPIRQYAVARRAHRPCDREDFLGVPEMGRKRRTCHLHRRLEINWGARPRRLRPRRRYKLVIGSQEPPCHVWIAVLLRSWTRKNLRGSRACGGCGQPRTGGAGPLMRGCPTAEGNHRPDVRGLLRRARGCPRPGSLHRPPRAGGHVRVLVPLRTLQARRRRDRVPAVPAGVAVCT